MSIEYHHKKFLKQAKEAGLDLKLTPEKVKEIDFFFDECLRNEVDPRNCPD